jgi:hypothetical protein
MVVEIIAQHLHVRPRAAVQIFFMMVPRIGRCGRRFPEVSAQAVDKGLICRVTSTGFFDVLLDA